MCPTALGRKEKKLSNVHIVHWREMHNAASNLKTHLLTHSGDKPHKCMQCNYPFTLAQALSKHIMTHTRVKPHQCNQCRYSTITNVRLHEMTHSQMFTV